MFKWELIGTLTRTEPIFLSGGDIPETGRGDGGRLPIYYSAKFLENCIEINKIGL